MKRLVVLIFIFTVLLFSEQSIDLVPLSKTIFKQIDKQGNAGYIDLTGKDFILVSVREENSDGRFYAVDRDGTVWLSGGVSSGEEVGYTPSGKWKITHKERFYTSKRYPEEDGSNNMDYSLFFTQWGHALHEGDIDYTSHGCIHVETHNIQSLFNWADIGMPILITRDSYMDFAREDLRRIYSKVHEYTRKGKR